jgi:hypothetical protein
MVSARAMPPRGPHQTKAAAFRPRQPDRRQRRAFRLIERRSGFERRADQPGAATGALLHLRDNPRLLVELLVLINLLSILDLSVTRRVLALGAVELNPVMAHLLAADATRAAGVKIALVAAGTLGLWLLRRRRPALQATLLLVAVFGLLIVYETVAFASLI